MVALYFWAAWIISLMDVGSCSALVLTGHVWPIHSFVTFLSTFWCVLWSTNSFVTSAQSGLSGAGRHHLFNHPTLIDLYLIFALGALTPPSFTGRMALSQARCPFLPFQIKLLMLFSITVRFLFDIPFTVIRYWASDITRVFESSTHPATDGYMQ